VKYIEPRYEHIRVRGRRRHCTICNTASTFLTPYDDVVEERAWLFDRQHSHGMERRVVN